MFIFRLNYTNVRIFFVGIVGYIYREYIGYLAATSYISEYFQSVNLGEFSEQFDSVGN